MSTKLQSNGQKKTLKKRKTKRSSKLYPALDPGVNLKSRIDKIDYDYIDKLNDEEKKFLNKFTEEYVNGYFKKHTKRINRNKKEMYDKNNAANRCLYTKTKSYGSLNYLEDFIKDYESRTDENSYTDNINDYIDAKRQLDIKTTEDFDRLSDQLDQFKYPNKKRNRTRKKRKKF